MDEEKNDYREKNDTTLNVQRGYISHCFWHVLRIRSDYDNDKMPFKSKR